VPDFLSIVANASHNLLWIVVKGGLVMIPLLASSIIALTVIVERLCFWRRLRSQTVSQTILTLVGEGDLPQAMQVASASRHPVAHVLGSGIACKHLSPGAAMQAAAQAELNQARRYLPILDTVITLAEALIATATGLLIAIMTLIPYNYFRSKVEQLTDVLEEQATRLELLLGKREE
jgi:biopolymer transport protein ExbB